MPNQLHFLRKINATDTGEEITLYASILPLNKGDNSPAFVANYYTAATTRVLRVVVWLIEKLVAKGVLTLADFDDFPLQNKIAGERVFTKADAQKGND